MSTRPGRWDLIGHASDPVPGDPAQIGDEAGHYSDVATAIADQIERLRALARPDEALEGKYADALQESCSELADNLDKIENRFAVVGSELTTYEPAVTSARSRTMAALHDAEDAQARMIANQPLDAMSAPGQEPTDAQVQATEARATRHSNAEGDLAAARSASDAALSTFDEVAEAVASRIRSASDDDMKDSRWDKFKNFVSKIATTLDFLADLMGWIAAILVIVALFIPGINILVIVALMVTALAIHSLLAATGNGSWVDVAFDVFALATLGVGQLGASAARAGRAATLAQAGRTAGQEAAEQTLVRASFNGGRGFWGGGSKLFNRFFSSGTRAAMRASADDAAREWTERALPNVRPLDVLRNGLDRDLAALARDRVAVIAELGGDIIRPGWNAGISVGRAAGFTNFGAGTTKLGLDGVKVGPFQLYEVGPFESWKSSWTTVWGGPF